MASIDDLGYVSITEMSHEEGISHIMQIRLNRRIVKARTKSKAKSTRKKKSVPNLTPEQALELLQLLGGKNV